MSKSYVRTPIPFSPLDPALNRRVNKFLDWCGQFKPDENGCMISDLKSSDPRGYTIKTCPILRKQDYLHRISYRICCDDLAPNQVVRHRCNNPRCFNFRHLVSGTQQDNMNDKMTAGRHKTRARGKGLNAETVRSIKSALLAGESGYAIAKKYGISQVAVSNIRRGRTHKQVTVAGFKPSPTRKPGRQPKSRRRTA